MRGLEGAGEGGRLRPSTTLIFWAAAAPALGAGGGLDDMAGFGGVVVVVLVVCVCRGIVRPAQVNGNCRSRGRFVGGAVGFECR